MNEISIDYKIIFESVPGCYLLLLPDLNFTIVGVSQAYLQATGTKRDAILDKGLFEVFPDNPNDPNATGVANLSASLLRAIKTKLPDQMAIQKYDIPIRGSESFEQRYWSPVNVPVIDLTNEVKYIIHTVTDVTKSMEEGKLSATFKRELEINRTELTKILEEIKKIPKDSGAK